MDAHEVESLREEITAIISIADPKKDKVLIRLESGGGVVHGYGLAASQLQRIKSAGIPLSVSIDKVAASGGYMMACVADHIIAAPFAIVGSIGVIAQEIEKIIPEVVKTDDEGMKSVAYGNISGLLIEAIKELKAEVDLLKSKPCNCNCKK